MGVDIYRCEDCEDCLFDCWVHCTICGKLLENENGRVCSDCFEDEKYDKYKLCSLENENESADFYFNLCEDCIRHTENSKLFERLIKELADDELFVDEVRKIFKCEDFDKIIYEHRDKYYGTSAQIKEFRNLIETNTKKIESLQQYNDRLYKKIETLDKLQKDIKKLTKH
jgi:hypothetical protein